jgi:DNA end-binding protein Ku
MLLDRSYYLEPDKTAAKAYALLRDALKAADRMAIVTVSLRARVSIAVLRVRDDVIVMQTMLWPDEIRSPEFASLGAAAEADAKPAELAMAGMLVESLAGDYVPDEYEDDYKQAVDALVKAKLDGGDVREVPAPQDTGGEVVDLLAALQQSVERAKVARGEAS